MPTASVGSISQPHVLCSVPHPHTHIISNPGLLCACRPCLEDLVAISHRGSTKAAIEPVFKIYHSVCVGVEQTIFLHSGYQATPLILKAAMC